jgi:glycosyltransferase involved in cell wall biosynthesis
MKNRIGNTNEIAIIIPALNEQKTISGIIRELLSMYPNTHIIVVDDGSSPPIYFSDQQNSQTFHLLRNGKNTGKGFSLRKGIRYAIEKLKVRYIITMDGDGQHAPGDIEYFLSHLDQHPFIIGKRDFKLSNMPLDRIFSNSLSSYLLSKKLKIKIEDSQCGFRGFQANVAKLLLDCRENGFQFETESIIQLAHAGYIPYFIPIQTIYNGSVSHINKISDIITFIKLYFKK